MITEKEKRAYKAERFQATRKVKRKPLATALSQNDGNTAVNKLIAHSNAPAAAPKKSTALSVETGHALSTVPDAQKSPISPDIKIVKLEDIFAQPTEYKSPAAERAAAEPAEKQYTNPGLSPEEIEAARTASPDDDLVETGHALSPDATLPRKSYRTPEMQAEAILRILNMVKTPWEKKIFRKSVLTDDAHRMGMELSRAINKGNKKKDQLTDAERAIYEDYKDYLAEAEGIEWDDEEIESLSASLAEGMEENNVQFPWYADFMLSLGVIEYSRFKLITRTR